MSNLNFDKKLVIFNYISWNEVEECLILRDERNNKFFEFYELGKFIIEKIIYNRSTIEEILNCIYSEYDADYDTIKNDVTEFITQIFEEEIVKYE